MYSTVGLLKNSKKSGKLIGTHQKLDKVARQLLSRTVKMSEKMAHDRKNGPFRPYFPTYREIVYFEGSRGPDGLKRKSPGKDEPMHFILPDYDDGRLWRYIENHLYKIGRAHV